MKAGIGALTGIAALVGAGICADIGHSGLSLSLTIIAICAGFFTAVEW